MKKLLIVEDDTGIANSLKLYLEHSDFDITLHHSGELAVEKILGLAYDLIILDVNLPVINGVDICKIVRKTSSVPILMLTARTSEVDRITGLENGADDYMAKPFSPRELLARINSILRRTIQSQTGTINNEEDIICFGNIQIDKKRRIILVNGTNVGMTKNEYNIFLTILDNNGGIVSRSLLMKQVIGYDKYMYDRTLDTHIKNIRRKIKDKSLIITVRGEGYRFNI